MSAPRTAVADSAIAGTWCSGIEYQEIRSPSAVSTRATGAREGTGLYPGRAPARQCHGAFADPGRQRARQADEHDGRVHRTRILAPRRHCRLNAAGTGTTCLQSPGGAVQRRLPFDTVYVPGGDGRSVYEYTNLRAPVKRNIAPVSFTFQMTDTTQLERRSVLGRSRNDEHHRRAGATRSGHSRRQCVCVAQLRRCRPSWRPGQLRRSTRTGPRSSTRTRSSLRK